MQANFIHFWWVESEFIVKNQFHNWTSELGCIWHSFFLENWALFGSFQALQFWQHSTRCCYSVFFSFYRAASTEVIEKGQKEPNFWKKMPKKELTSSRTSAILSRVSSCKPAKDGTLLRNAECSACRIRPVLIIIVWKHCLSIAQSLQSTAAFRQSIYIRTVSQTFFAEFFFENLHFFSGIPTS